MASNVHLTLALVFTLTQSLGAFGQQATRTQTKHKQAATQSTCGDVTGEFRETPKAGVANVICFTTGFNVRRDACWQQLAEYYYNVAPEPGVKIQHVYFVEVPKGTKPIRTLAELKNSSFKHKTLLEFTVNMTTEKFTSKKYPFAAK